MTIGRPLPQLVADQRYCRNRAYPRGVNFEGGTLTMFAGLLGMILDRPVIDKTGITDLFAIRLEFSPDEFTSPRGDAVAPGTPAAAGLRETLGIFQAGMKDSSTCSRRCSCSVYLYAAGAIRPYGDARAAVNVIGMTSVTGLPETWLVEEHYSFASVEDTDRALDAAGAFRSNARQVDSAQDDIMAPAHTLLLRYRPDLSYRPDQAIRMFPRSRYFHVTIYRVRQATDAEFHNMVDLRRRSLDSVNPDRPDIAYDVISGAPSGTYIFLAPIVTLRTMDEGVPTTPVYAQGLADARAKARATTPQGDIGREHVFLRVEPGLSYVSDEFAEVDRGVWRGK